MKKYIKYVFAIILILIFFRWPKTYGASINAQVLSTKSSYATFKVKTDQALDAIKMYIQNDENKFVLFYVDKSPINGEKTYKISKNKLLSTQKRKIIVVGYFNGNERIVGNFELDKFPDSVPLASESALPSSLPIPTKPTPTTETSSIPSSSTSSSPSSSTSVSPSSSNPPSSEEPRSEDEPQTREEELEADETLQNNPKTNVSFEDIKNGASGKTIATNNGVKLREAIVGYKLMDKSLGFQNFAITDDFVYFSRAEKSSSNTNQIIRISRTYNTYEVMKVLYSGHGQSFDVANKASTGRDLIFLNNFAREIRKGLPYQREHGLAIMEYKGKGDNLGFTKIPELSFAYNNKNNKLVGLTKVESKDFNTDADYYNNTKKYDNNSKYLQLAQVAVDEEHDQLAFYNYLDKKFYIYKLNDFKQGNLSLITSFSSGTGYGQGIEIYGDYAYHYSGNKKVTIKRYNIKTKATKSASFNVGGEGEGITIYKGKVYVAVAKNGVANIYYVDGL